MLAVALLVIPGRVEDANPESRATNSAVIARLDRAIQYAALSRFYISTLEYWIPAFAGMTSYGMGR